MPVTEDQRALLRLLIDGSSYTEIAELLGVGESEVRARAAKAVEDVEEEGTESDLAAAAKTRIGQLEGTEPTPVPTPLETRPQRFGPAAWLLIGGAVALVVVLIVVLSSGGSDQSDGTSSSQSAQEDVVTINMTPVGGGNGHGTVRIVRVADRPAVDLEIGGLRPSGTGETYVLSLVDSSSGKSLPVAFRQVGPDGRFTGRSEIADAASGLLPDFDTVEIALAQDRDAAASVQQAAKNATLPTRIGTPVLRGNLPHS